jgi:hypothetical protein
VELNVDFQLLPDTISNFLEIRKRLKTTINELPSMVADRIIDFVTFSPLRLNHLDMSTLINLFYDLESFSSNKYGDSDLISSITVLQPRAKEEPINKPSYIKLIMDIFQIIIHSYLYLFSFNSMIPIISS